MLVYRVLLWSQSLDNRASGHGCAWPFDIRSTVGSGVENAHDYRPNGACSYIYAYRHYLSQSSRNCEELTRTALIGELWLVEKRLPISTFPISIFLAGHVLNANGGESILIIRNSLFVSPTRSSNKRFKYNYQTMSSLSYQFLIVVKCIRLQPTVRKLLDWYDEYL